MSNTSYQKAKEDMRLRRERRRQKQLQQRGVNGNGNTTTVLDNLDTTEIITVGLGKVGDNFNEYVQQFEDIDPTVTIANGSAIGVIFTADAVLKTEGV